MYSIIYTKRALAAIPKLKASGLLKKTKNLIEMIKNNPYQNPPAFEKLQGDFRGAYSRRINIKHRLVYEIYDDKNIVKIVSMWTHYE